MLPVRAGRPAGRDAAGRRAAGSASTRRRWSTGSSVRGPRTLADVLAWLRGRGAAARARPGAAPGAAAAHEDLAEVVGQERARRAAEVAAAGGHHMCCVGPPGSGKTMIARRLAGMLPDLEVEEAMEVAAVRSLAGALAARRRLTAPRRSSRRTTALSAAALVGGGAGLARPGAVSLAHRGVLFLDEVYEFGPHLLDAPAHAPRGGRGAARPQGRRGPLPGALPAGDGGEPVPVRARPATPTAPARGIVRRRYASRLSGPMLDRVDLRIELEPARPATLRRRGRSCSRTPPPCAARVLAARAAARQRWAATGWRSNAEVPGPGCAPDAAAPAEVHRASSTSCCGTACSPPAGSTARLRVALTTADLRGGERPDAADVHAALELRVTA